MSQRDISPRFLVVVCDPVAPSGLIGQTILAEGGFYNSILPGEDFASWSPQAYPGLPASSKDYGGLVILGGRMSANEVAENPHFAELEDLARDFETAEKPVLGACLGAQIIARAHGARVWTMDRLESGFVELEVTEAGRRDPLFAGLGARLTLFQNHYEAFELPAGGETLLTGGLCEVQAFRLGRATYCFQFHLEVSVDSVREWMRLFGTRLFADEPRLLSDLDAGFRAHMENQRRLASRVFGRWVALARPG